MSTARASARGWTRRVSDRGAFADKLAAAVGTDDPRRTSLYWIMLMLAVHDLAVLRAILGAPADITHMSSCSALAT